mmetsp:Transcript_23319/g.45880  ORF Transcript_23319/g.45880 Transcript_23319/m.45880 type:complete len:169 (+) Transcript_23319:217-723(+)
MGPRKRLHFWPSPFRLISFRGSRLCLCLCLNASLSLLSVSTDECGTTARNVGVQLIASMGGGAVDARNAEAPPSAHLPSSPFCSAATQEQQRSLEEFECRVGLVCFFQDVLYFPSVHSSSLQCLPAYRSIDRWKEGRICLIPSCIHSTGTPLHPRQGGRQEVSLSGGG